MSAPANTNFPLPPEQRAIRDKCFHPSRTFVEFKKEETEQSIPERFEKIVRRYPNRIAVKSKNHVLTYQELNRLSNRVAHDVLTRHGAEHGPVALLLENDAPMIAAILGVLKAGKIYVPLDPSFAASTLAFILKDSQASLLLTNHRNAAGAKKIAAPGSVALNIDELSDGRAGANMGLSLAPDTLASVIYTSGSTGEPKGVTQSHRNLLQKAMTDINEYHIEAQDRVSLLYSCAFSASARCIFGALLSGAALFPFDVREEGIDRLATWLARDGITLYLSVPTLFRGFLSMVDENDKLASVRLIYLGSESVSTKDVELFKKHFTKSCVLVNSLASGEAGTTAMYFIGHDTKMAGDIVPVGYAAPDKEVLLLDEQGIAVSAGEVGEIAVRSRYLSPGYWRKPDLTRIKFSAYSDDQQERIYRTGDLGRMRADGCLEYLGRRDSSVKVRGLWTEIAAIERKLTALKSIKEVLVVSNSDEKEGHRLVAYVVPATAERPTASVVRRYLKDELPNHMMPSNFVFLEALPLTATGKVDRKALPDPVILRAEIDAAYVGPRSPAERELVQIWGEALSLDKVGIHDNFFDLGGHSLAAIQVVSQVIKKFQLELPLGSLLAAKTIAEMAVIVTEYQGKKLGEKEMETILTELESLTDEQAQRLLLDEVETEHRKD